MAVQDYHVKYEIYAPEWQAVQDTIDGESTVKNKKKTYLPMPPAIECEDPYDTQGRYAFYLSFAELPELAAPASRTVAGIIIQKPPVIKLPVQMEYLRERATRSGLTLMDFYHKIVENSVNFGRYGILTDAPEDGGNPYMVGYKTMDIRNWNESEFADRRATDLVVLDESFTQVNVSDFENETVTRFRVLYLDQQEVYHQDVYQALPTQTNESKSQAKTEVVPEKIGETTPNTNLGDIFDDIPFVFIGSTGLDVDPDQIPMIGVTRNVLSAYRKQATYGRSLFMAGDPTPVVIGMSKDDENAPTVIGSGSIWYIPTKEGNAKFLEINGKSISSNRDAIQDNIKQANIAGARLLEDAGAGESGEALRLRATSQVATARSISITCASGLEKALRYCARFLGLNEEEVKVYPNLDFITVRMTGQELMEFMQAKTMGAPLSEKSLHDIMRRGELTDKEYEDEVEEIEDEGGNIPQSFDENLPLDGTIQRNLNNMASDGDS